MLLDPEPEARDQPLLGHYMESRGQLATRRGLDHDRGHVSATCRLGLFLLPLLLPLLYLPVASRSVQRLDSVLIIFQLAIINIDGVTYDFLLVRLTVSSGHHSLPILRQVWNNMFLP